jgi:hypothetical protein
MDVSKHIFCEPLESLLNLYENKEEVLCHFLPGETIEQISKHTYLDLNDEIFVHEHLLCVSKQTGLLVCKGKIVDIKDMSDSSGGQKLFTIRSQGRNLRISSRDSYLFKKHTHKQSKYKSEFLKNLLETL